MIPEPLQKLVMCRKAQSFTLSLGGSGLSSWKIPDGHFLYVWSVQIFPMVDVANATPSDVAAKAERTAHYYEFDDNNKQGNRVGIMHRSTLVNLSTAAVPNQFGVGANSDVTPVFWFFQGDYIVCRIFHFPQLAAAAPVDVPPGTEAGAIGGYPAASTVVVRWPTGAAASEAWEMDERRDVGSPPYNRSARPFAIAGNILQIPTDTAGIAKAYAWPLVNLQCIIYPVSEQKSLCPN